jgi:hypothetical protein
LYFVNGSLGTPAQSFRWHLDTGSSDLWVNTPGSQLCQMQNNPCQVSGTYSANSSSTYGYVGSYFNISYVDGSGASGDYVTDTVNIAGSSMANFQFGVGYVSTSSQGILGVGYPVNEVQVGRARKKPYDNLPAKMVANGLIASNAYSLYLNDLDASTGNILFGGVDTEQYFPPLISLPIQAEAGVFAEFLITLTKLQLGSTVLGNNMALAVLLDSGSSLTYLPDDIVQTIFTMTSAIYQQDEGVAFVPCSMGNTKANLTFTFSGVNVNVPMDELVLDLIPITGKRLAFSNGVPACLFGIAPAGEGTNVLGDTFLRSAYVVYDLANNEISLAQTRFNSTRSNILEIGTGTASVPSATDVSNPVAATAGILRNPNAAPPNLGPMAASVAAAAGALITGIVMYLL